ncbi:DUF4153 domain-containing protein [bacterium]|nr:DUF4153 domain-containing protein [bacterium]
MINLPSLTEVKHQLYQTAKRFPLPTLCAAIVTALGIYLTHDSTYPNTPPDWVWQGLLTAMLGLVSLSALTLVAESTTKFNRGLLMLGGTALLGIYFWTLPGDETSEGSLWIMRHIFLMLGSLVALTWVPFWQQGVSNKTLWLWISELIGNIVITLFFAIVLFLGLAAALWSVEMLFDLDIDSEFYFDIWIIIAGLFSPLFFLSQFIPEPSKLKEPKSVSAFMGIFTKYIMTPLAAGYMVILYSYTAKILITWEWPKNVLGWLVIAFLGVAIFTYFLWTPLWNDKWNKYRRLFWLILIPQIFLLFIAIGWRIKAYSWTENRYFVVVLGLWLLGTTLYFLIRKDAKFKWVFVALTAIIFVSQIGPLSGYNIGRIAQTNRLENLLTEVKVLQNDEYVPTTIETNNETEDEIASILDYLSNTYGADQVKEMFPKVDYSNTSDYLVPRIIMEQLGLEYRNKWTRNNNNENMSEYLSFYTNMEKPLDIADFDWRVALNGSTGGENDSGINGYYFRASSGNKPPSIEIRRDNALIDTIDLTAKLDSLLKTDAQRPNPGYDPEETMVLYESDLLRAKIYLTNGWKNNDDYTNFGAEMYVSFKN